VPETLKGRTSQGRAITLQVSGDKVSALDMTFRAPCGDGRVWSPRWWPAEGAPVHFHNDGHRFHVRESGADVELWMTGHTSADRRSVSGITRFTGRSRGSVCDSGIVTFVSSG